MSIHQLHSRFVAERFEPLHVGQPAVASWVQSDQALDRPDDLPPQLLAIAKRQSMTAHSLLFADGDPAKDFFFVAAGQLLVHRHCVAPKARAIIQSLTVGDLFVFNCEGHHVGNCIALVDSLLLRISCRDLEALAAQDETVNSMLKAVHANELTFVLRSRGQPVAAN
jgi:CRP-like cAMP-binding protein